MAGRTPDEVAGISNQMYGAMVSGGQPPQQMTPQQPQQPTYQQNPGYTAPPAGSDPNAAATTWDDMNPQASVDARIAAAQQQFAPQIQQQAEAMGQMARALVAQSDSNAFERWGPEIDMELVRLQPNMKTEQNIRLIVDMVRGRHVGELQAEAEARVRSEYQTGDIRPDGGGGVPTGAQGVLDLDSVQAPLYKELLARHRIDEATLRETFTKYPAMYAGNTFDEKVQSWIAAANKGDILTEVAFKIGE